MADRAKPTDPAAEPNDDVKARVALLQGRESDHTRGEISVSGIEDDTLPVGQGGVRHYDGTVVKVNADGERVLSSYVDPSADEKLAAEVEAEEESERAAKAREDGPKAVAGKSPDTEAGKSPAPVGSDGDSSVADGPGGTGSDNDPGEPSDPPVIRELP